MDFYSLPRRQLQALCKQHKIPANTTNVAMATALDKLLNKGDGGDVLPPAVIDLLTPSKPPATSATIAYSGRVTRSQKKNLEAMRNIEDPDVKSTRKKLDTGVADKVSSSKKANASEEGNATLKSTSKNVSGDGEASTAKITVLEVCEDESTITENKAVEMSDNQHESPKKSSTLEAALNKTADVSEVEITSKNMEKAVLEASEDEKNMSFRKEVTSEVYQAEENGNDVQEEAIMVEDDTDVSHSPPVLEDDVPPLAELETAKQGEKPFAEEVPAEVEAAAEEEEIQAGGDEIGKVDMKQEDDMEVQTSLEKSIDEQETVEGSAVPEKPVEDVAAVVSEAQEEAYQAAEPVPIEDAMEQEQLGGEVQQEDEDMKADETEMVIKQEEQDVQVETSVQAETNKVEELSTALAQVALGGDEEAEEETAAAAAAAVRPTKSHKVKKAAGQGKENLEVFNNMSLRKMRALFKAKMQAAKSKPLAANAQKNNFACQ